MFSFSKNGVFHTMERPARFSTGILVGPGSSLTPRFVHTYEIDAVINCADDNACPEWWRMRYPERYVCIHAIDSPDHDIRTWYPQFEDALYSFLRKGMTVYVHCRAGINRSAILSLMYVCSQYAFDLNRTIASTLAQRPQMFQNQVFMNQAREFINGRIQSAKDS